MAAYPSLKYNKNVDATGDGKVDISDILLLKGYFNKRADVITPSPCW
jgi:hypothetical protein